MMNEDDGMFTCRNTCWIAGVLLGLVAFLLIGGLLGAILGIVVAVAIAFGLRQFFCAEGPGAGVTTAGGAAAAVGSSVPAAKPTDDAAKPEKAADEAAAEARTAADAQEAETAAAKAEAARKAAAEKAAAETGQASKAEAEAAAAKARAAEKTAEQTRASHEGGTRPEALDEPRGGEADDLKLIKGVGPKLESMLNDLGFYHYDQIAHWSPQEVAWVDANLKGFKGRVSRDNWVDQAKTLASGEATDFSRRAASSGKYDE